MPEALPDWTQMDKGERLALVTKLASERCSAGGIALRFTNATRMSVVGLCSRKKIQLRGTAPKPPAQKKRQPAPKAAAPSVPAVKAAPTPREAVLKPAPDITGLVNITDLKAHQCRWIEGDPRGEHGYCGQPVRADSSYCHGHHARVYLGLTR